MGVITETNWGRNNGKMGVTEANKIGATTAKIKMTRRASGISLLWGGDKLQSIPGADNPHYAAAHCILLVDLGSS